jgi:hypothetical protein
MTNAYKSSNYSLSQLFSPSGGACRRVLLGSWFGLSPRKVTGFGTLGCGLCHCCGVVLSVVIDSERVFAAWVVVSLGWLPFCDLGVLVLFILVTM